VGVGGEVSDSKKMANSYRLAERRFWSWDYISAAAERKPNSKTDPMNKVLIMGPKISSRLWQEIVLGETEFSLGRHPIRCN
jgi:hypothetical protein